MSTTRRNMMAAGRRAAVDWESIARGMVDCVTEFELTDLTATRTDNYQFQNRIGLKAVVIDTTNIGQMCFSGCVNLESVTFPSNLDTIQFQSFNNCRAIKTLRLPASLTTIGQYAFNNCRGLVSVILEPTTPPTISSYSWNGTTCNFYVPDESVAAYKAASGWSALADRIKPLSELVE